MSGVGMLSHAQCVGYLLCSEGKWDIGSGFQLYILPIGVRTILHLQSINGFVIKRNYETLQWDQVEKSNILAVKGGRGKKLHPLQKQWELGWKMVEVSPWTSPKRVERHNKPWNPSQIKGKKTSLNVSP